jgi:hypothetical protein
MRDWENEVITPLCEKLLSEEGGFYVYKKQGHFLLKDINDKFALMFYHSQQWPWCFGFHHFNDTIFSTTQKSELGEILNRLEFSDRLSKDIKQAVGFDFYKEIDIQTFDDENRDSADIVNWIYDRYKLLEQTVNSLGIS